jgi:hypothetical protein
MTTTDALTSARSAHAAMLEAQTALNEATTARDVAIAGARTSGVSAIEIAEALALSRQQVHRILERATGPENDAVHLLRAEVMTPGGRYEDLIEDDQWFVDSAVATLARQRGISLD